MRITVYAVFIICIIFAFSSCSIPTQPYTATPIPTQSSAVHSPKPTPAITNKSVSLQLDELIARYSQNDVFSGTVLVSKSGKTILSEGYGMADHDAGTPNTPDTKYFLASITKSFTAVAIMQLVEQGLVDLDASITEYLPHCSNWKDITIRQILLHKAGLVRFDELPYAGSGIVPDYDMITKAQELPLLFAPGTQSSYSNLGFYLLGVVIEKASGKPYAQYMSENIFIPAGMSHSGCAVDADDNELCAQPFSIVDGRGGNSALLPIYKLYSAGCIYSTVEDMHHYYNALKGDTLLKSESKDVIFSSMFSAEAGQRFFPCMGATDNLFCSFERYPDEDTVIIILSNVGMMQCMPMKNQLTSAVFSDE